MKSPLPHCLYRMAACARRAGLFSRLLHVSMASRWLAVCASVGIVVAWPPKALAQTADFLRQASGDETPAFRQTVGQRLDQGLSTIAGRLRFGAQQRVEQEPRPARQQNGWVQTVYQQHWQQADAASHSGGYRDQSAALTIGQDRALSPRWRVGAAVMLNHDTLHFDSRTASAHSNGAQAVLYGNFAPEDGPFYLTGIASYGWWNNTLSRQVALDEWLSGHPRGSFSTSGETLYAETGLNLSSSLLGRVQPYLGASVGRYQQQGYAEKASAGLAVFDLRYDASHSSAVASVLGIRLNAPSVQAFGRPLRWWSDLSWQHRFGAMRYSQVAAFTVVPDAPYSIAGTKLDRNTLHTTLGVVWQVGMKTSLYLSGHSATAAASHVYAADGGVQWQW